MLGVNNTKTSRRAGHLTTAICALCCTAGAVAGDQDDFWSDSYREVRRVQFIDRYDRDADGRVSSIEFEQARRDRFDITDEDASGTVSREEYVYEWEDRLDAQMIKDRASEVKQTQVRFGALDRNDDERMTWREYQASGKRMFKAHDGNRDGKIDAEEPNRPRERARTARKIDPEQMKAWQLARVNRMLRMPSTHRRSGVMVRYDTDGDELVTRKEFNAQRRSDFDRTDADGNGWLSADEYLAEYEDRLDAEIEIQRRESVEQAGRRFAALDDDEDAAMTFAEYQDSGHSMFARHDASGDGYVTTSDPLPAPPTQVAAVTTTNDAQQN
ncbi:MAG: hypothetical protein AAF515_02950 [Pseudomonadota bacterium]